MSFDQHKFIVATDVVLFSKDDENILSVLLIQRKNDPFKEKWALPGGMVEREEELEAAAKRELLEETGVKINALRQLRTFGSPHRDPRGRVISVVFTSFIDRVYHPVQAGSDAQDARWFSIHDLPDMAFDHFEIIQKAKVLEFN